MPRLHSARERIATPRRRRVTTHFDGACPCGVDHALAANAPVLVVRPGTPENPPNYPLVMELPVPPSRLDTWLERKCGQIEDVFAGGGLLLFAAISVVFVLAIAYGIVADLSFGWSIVFLVLVAWPHGVMWRRVWREIRGHRQERLKDVVQLPPARRHR